MTMNVDNLIKVVEIGARLGTVAGKVFEDGKISASDLICLPEFVKIFSSLVEVQWNQIIPEAKDLSEDEAKKLVDAFISKFAIPQENARITIDTVLSVVARIVALILGLINIFKH